MKNRFSEIIEKLELKAHPEGGYFGETPQVVVPAGCWFAAEVVGKKDFSLVGCTVSPGFDFRDFEMRSRKELIEMFPEHEAIISKLTRN